MVGQEIQEATPSRLGFALIAVGIVSAIVLSSTMFRDYPLVLDEHGSYWLLESDIPSSLMERSLNYAAIPPLSAWMEQLTMLLPIRPERAFRLPSMFCFCCGVAIVGYTGTRFADSVTGGLATILLAWHPLALNEIRIARCYGLVVLEAAALMWITLAWWQRPRDARLAITFALITVAMAWTHYLAVLFACVCGAAMILIPRGWLGRKNRGQRPSAGLIAVVVVIATLTCLPLIPPLLRLNGWSPFMELQSVIPELTDVAGPVWLVGMPALLIATLVISLVQPKRIEELCSNLQPLLVVSGAIALGSLSIFLVFGIVGPHSLAANPRYQVAFTVAQSLFMATVIRRLTLRLRYQGASVVAIAAVCLGATWGAVGSSPLFPIRIAAATGTATEWKQASQLISNTSHKNDLILVQSGLVESYLVPMLYEDALFMEYVACRIGKLYLPEQRRRMALPSFWSSAPEMTEFFRKEFQRLQTNGASIWIASATETDIMQRSLHDTRRLLSNCGWQCVHSEEKNAMTLERYEFELAGTAPKNRTGSLNKSVFHD